MNELLLRKSLKSSADVEVLMRFSKPGPDSWVSRFTEGSGTCWVSAGCPWKMSDMKRDARSSKSSFIGAPRSHGVEEMWGDVRVSGCIVVGVLEPPPFCRSSELRSRCPKPKGCRGGGAGIDCLIFVHSHCLIIIIVCYYEVISLTISLTH